MSFSEYISESAKTPVLSPRDGRSVASSVKRSVIAAVVVAVLLVLWWVGQNVGVIEYLSRYEFELRRKIHARPVLSVGLGLLVYTLLSLVPGSGGKSIVTGWLFGMISGLCIVMIGIVAGAVITFQLSRTFLRDAVESKLRSFITFINRALKRDGPFYLLSLRMAPVSYTLINYGCGATRLRFSTFLWTTFLGLLPTSVLLVYVGTQLPTLREIATEGMWSVLEPSFVMAILGLAAFPMVTRQAARGVLQLHRRFGRDPRREADGEVGEERDDDGSVSPSTEAPATPGSAPMRDSRRSV